MSQCRSRVGVDGGPARASVKAKAAFLSVQEVIIDTIDIVDGLERLIVVIVGELD